MSLIKTPKNVEIRIEGLELWAKYKVTERTAYQIIDLINKS